MATVTTEDEAIRFIKDLYESVHRSHRGIYTSFERFATLYRMWRAEIKRRFPSETEDFALTTFVNSMFRPDRRTWKMTEKEILSRIASGPRVEVRQPIHRVSEHVEEKHFNVPMLERARALGFRFSVSRRESAPSEPTGYVAIGYDAAGREVNRMFESERQAREEASRMAKEGLSRVLVVLLFNS